MGTAGILNDKIKFSFENIDNVAETILWEASQRSPFDAEGITLSYKILQKNEDEKNMLVLLVAAKDQNMQEFIDAMYEAKLRPTIIDVSSYAFNNCYALESSELIDFRETLVLMDIGHQGSRLLFIKDGVYHSARDINIGGEYITKTLQKQLRVDYGHAVSIMQGLQVEGISLDAIQSSLQFSFEEFVSSFDMAWSYYSKDSGDSVMEKLVVCGGGVYIPGLIQFLSRHLGIEVRVSNPFSFLKYDSKVIPKNVDTSKFAALFSVATGLALRGFNSW
jgi:type IV pilus assembly protein PilM